MVAPGASRRISNKITFCIIDTEVVDPGLPGAPQTPQYQACNTQVQGLSVGWGDTYPWNLAGQAIDITGLPNGDYRLTIQVDPRGRLAESNDANNDSTVMIRLTSNSVSIIPSSTPTATPTGPPAATSTPAPPTATPIATSTPGPAMLYFAVQNNGTAGGLSVANEDIVTWDGGSGFNLLFDGSDVGLGARAIDAFAVTSSNEILLSFTAAGSVPGIGTVDDSDVVLFTATSLGLNTAGSFTLFFDGSDVGLSGSGEDVDAIEVLTNGHLLLSTVGSATVTGVSAADEDVMEFTSTSLGSTTSGTWALYFDGSDVGLGSSSSEDVDGLALGAAGTIYLSTTGSFSVTGIAGADEDVFVFTPSSLGSVTSGTYASTLFFDGSVHGLGNNDLFAIDLP